MFHRMLKRTLLCTPAVRVLIILVLGLLPLVQLKAQDMPRFADLPLYQWVEIDLSDQAQCSDGSPYNVSVRRGESENLVIHFAGGGAAWNAKTAAHPITMSDFTGFYIPQIYELLRGILGGMFLPGADNNPFHDWTIVYLPYCTADFHIGTTSQTFTTEEDEEITIHFNGRQNVTETLAWVYQTFASPEKLVISGESAGAFGSLFWTSTIAQHYPDSEIYQIADGAFIETAQWPTIVNTTWKADTRTDYGFTVEDDLIGSVYQAYAETSAPNITYLHLNTLYDESLIHFSAEFDAVANDSAHKEGWSQAMLESMQRIDESDLNYFYFLTDYGFNPETGVTPHTILSWPLFYQMEEDGIVVNEWLHRIIIEGERFSVGSEFLP